MSQVAIPKPLCPECGRELLPEEDALRCEVHGLFFLYGPALLVRTPDNNAKLSQQLLPWETEKQPSSRS
jgi:hypothetical protein